MDCWYPDSESRKTVCGKLGENSFLCPQDYMHTKVTVDKDICYPLIPSERFKSVLTNRWTKETSEEIEGEVKPFYLSNYKTQTGKSTETNTPRNPALLQIKANDNICMYGPWMGDILDLNLKIPIPLTSESIELGNIDLRKHNEIHPVNQLWRKSGNEWQLTAIADGTGYFEKVGNGEIQASGLNQQMRFYIAFLIPGGPATMMNNTIREYDINAVGFEFTDIPAQDIQPETITLKNNGALRLKVNDNSIIRNQRTHKVFLDKVRKRPATAITVNLFI